jgi:hypothetical protein
MLFVPVESCFDVNHLPKRFFKTEFWGYGVPRQRFYFVESVAAQNLLGSPR